MALIFCDSFDHNKNSDDWFAKMGTEFQGSEPPQGTAMTFKLKAGGFAHIVLQGPEISHDEFERMREIIEGLAHIVTKLCENSACKKEFVVRRRGQKFCSAECSRRQRQRNYWKKTGKRLREERRSA